MTKRVVGAGAFKQGCLAMLDAVAGGTVEIVITKRGRPVARLVPIVGDAERERAILADLRTRAGALKAKEADLVAPSSRLAKWSAAGRRP